MYKGCEEVEMDGRGGGGCDGVARCRGEWVTQLLSDLWRGSEDWGGWEDVKEEGIKKEDIRSVSWGVGKNMERSKMRVER